MDLVSDWLSDWLSRNIWLDLLWNWRFCRSSEFREWALQTISSRIGMLLAFADPFYIGTFLRIKTGTFSRSAFPTIILLCSYNNVHEVDAIIGSNSIICLRIDICRSNFLSSLARKPPIMYQSHFQWGCVCQSRKVYEVSGRLFEKNTKLWTKFVNGRGEFNLWSFVE